MDAKVMEEKMAQWLPIFEAQARSGMGKERWCDANGVKSREFFKWQRKIRQYLPDYSSSAAPASTAPCLPAETGFVDITPAPVSSLALASDESATAAGASGHAAGPVSSIRVRYGGFTLELSSGIDKKLLTTVLEVIRDAD